MANTMPVKIPLASLLQQNANFAQAVQAFGKNLSDAKKHEMFPYLSLVEEVRKRMNKQHLDLKVAVTFSPKLADSRCSIYPVEGVWDLFFCFLEQDDGVSLGVIANPEVFDDEAMSKLQAGFLDTVKLTQTDASFKLQELPFLKAREVANIAQGPPSDDVEAINASRVHVWIKSRAAQQPNAVALFSAERNESMTYGDLARKSSQIAQYLAANKVKTGDGVLLHIHRGFDTVLWILGVLEVGAYYVVLDKKLPDRRKTAIISISEARFLVTDNFEIQQNIADMNMTIFNLDIVKQELQAQPNTTLQSMTDDNSLAYVVFTSGSTGQPKGVMVEHSNLSHYVSAARSVVKIGPGSRVLQFATFAFDASILEWAVTLSFGATLCFVNHPELLVGDYLTSVIDQNQINFFHTTPSVLATIPAERNLDSLTMISVGGEPSSAGLLGMWRQKAQILHAYGPTETTVIVTVEILEKELCNDSLPSPSRIGKAFPNSEILICPNNSNESNAPGQQGEICIAGVQVSRGYIGQPDLTKRSFQTIQRNGRNVRLYRSGDKGFIDKDGTVCISGRMKSREIKLRGYRMDLYEIEKSILDHSPEVQATSVQVVGDTLVAFIVPDTAPCDTIRDRLALDVPAYSVPGRFLAVKALPLNENGKIDHGKVHAQLEALSKPVRETSAVQKKQNHAHAVPQDMPTYRHISRALEELWMQTLNLTGKPAAGTSFFEAGGHSITLVELHKGILKRFPGCKLSLLDIFQAPTIKTQASRLLEILPLSNQHYASSESSLDDKTDSDGDTVPTSLESSLNLDDNKFAIVGLAGHFPKAVDVNEFWQILVEGKTGISTHESAVTPSDMAEDEIFVRRYGSLPELPALDVSAWNMTQEEADLMDPQKLLFLSVASKALADAEIPIAKGVPNPIGVFVGAAHNTHKDVPGMAIPTDSFQARHRGLLDPPISTFTAYKLNLTGPNATLNTACSSSLVALQHAVSALRAGECPVALVGGVTVAFPRLGGYVTAPAQVFSPSGHCRPLSDDADGSVPADAVTAIVVKPLSIARRDNDAVYAVIEGCATGSDGAVDKIGFNVPSSSGQARAIAAAMRRAGVTPETIRYVELHGSGTSMGDALEVNGLERALDELSKPSTTVEGIVHVGSNKGVFGNTEAASGLLSLTKMALALSNGFVPPIRDLGYPEVLDENSVTPAKSKDRPRTPSGALGEEHRVSNRNSYTTGFDSSIFDHSKGRASLAWSRSSGRNQSLREIPFDKQAASRAKAYRQIPSDAVRQSTAVVKS
ncbi:putative secondary metabolism biosynthetic enzyme [Curvularia kusanoi]|uniref:Secondary metabolism biosynthetic enzyme n=1 Tax=Curvularia kusanoi TaxID=90978 RepID=A0A9P4TIL4_CURKU|nr:putative secondary metabolism biosynthetic enzyme [Curvularia kusanoi]